MKNQQPKQQHKLDIQSFSSSESCMGSKQKGVILVITVILLFVVAIISLYAMRGTILQDKMTANINNKTITYNVAEQGALTFMDWFQIRLKQHGWPTTEADKNAWRNTVIPVINSGFLSPNSGSNGYYWVDENFPDAECEGLQKNPCWDDVNKIVTVYVTGNLIKSGNNETKILGESFYKIQLAAQNGGKSIPLPELPAALTFAGHVNQYIGANSNVYKIQGGDRLAIATDNASAEQLIKNSIPDNRADADHYGGTCSNAPCVSAADLGIWGQPDQVMELAEQLSHRPDATVYEGNFSGKLPCQGIVIVYGSMPVNGNIAGNGCNNEFNGVLIVLGGGIDVKGGGALDIEGAVYVANIQKTDTENSKPTYVFASQGGSFKGGGNMTITYNNRYFAANSAGNIFNGNQPTGMKVISWTNII